MVMDGIIRPSVTNGGGGGAAALVVDDDLGDGMQCTDHPYRNNTPGGICAFCLQEKLGKLVSSSSSSFFIGSSTTSSSPSIRSEINGTSMAASSIKGFGGLNSTTTATSAAATSSTANASSTAANSLALSLSIRPAPVAATSSAHESENDGYYNNTRRARIPFLLTQKKKKKMISSSSTIDHQHHPSSNNLILKRSKSTATPRRGHYQSSDGEDFSPHSKRGFWSFFHLSKHSSNTTTTAAAAATTTSSASAAARRSDKVTPRDLKSTSLTRLGNTADSGSGSGSLRTDNAAKVVNLSSSSDIPGVGTGSVTMATMATKRIECTVIDETDSPNSSSSNATSFGRKVSRSRSVGCGSRRFSGDFFERISTGFGDCTLRRVESQREGKRSSSVGTVRGGGDIMKERVRCGGIFSGFMITSSSSSSSSSSYWVSSGSEDQVNGKGHGGLGTGQGGPLAHGRSKSWGWAFASPRRALGNGSNRPTTAGKSNNGGSGGAGSSSSNNKSSNTTPNLSAIPSLLTVR